MTKAEIIELQQSLNRQGFDLVVDGHYGKQTHDAYTAYLDRDPEVPTVVPPAPIPWWRSRSILGLLATVIAGLLGRSGYLVDSGELTNVLLQAVEVVGLAMAFIGTVRRRAPIDPTLVASGLRINSPSVALPADGKPDRKTGPFGY